jgi:senataxin
VRHCCHLFAGHPCLEGSCFPVVICDEAAQCVEVSTLIPLRHGAVQCVMVGDHKQLSATTFSKESAVKGFDISLFERLQTAVDEDQCQGKCVDGAVMLNTQYRMLPEICRFPSRTFYRNELKDGDNVKAPFYAPSYLDSRGEVGQSGSSLGVFLKPFLFFDLLESKESFVSASSSYCNKQEALLCVNLVQQVITESLRMQCKIGSIGIITPYQEQLTELKSCFLQYQNGLLPSKCAHAKLNTDTLEEGEVESEEDIAPSVSLDFSEYDIEMNTVDAFQGREKDIIIFSCVRANSAGNIGFLSDKRRMNVALTRARFGLYVIGSADTLRRSYIWNSLILHASEHASVVTMSTARDDIRERSRVTIGGGNRPPVCVKATSAGNGAGNGAAASAAACAAGGAAGGAVDEGIGTNKKRTLEEVVEKNESNSASNSKKLKCPVNI